MNYKEEFSKLRPSKVSKSLFCNGTEFHTGSIKHCDLVEVTFTANSLTAVGYGPTFDAAATEACKDYYEQAEKKARIKAILNGKPLLVLEVA